MAQSNAERQRRYRERLKALAADGSNAVRRLNDAYNAAAAEQRDEALARIRQQIARSKDENFIRAMQDMLDGLPPPSYKWTVEDWCRIARLLGKADEASTVAEAQKEALRQRRARTPPNSRQRPWAPFRHVALVPEKTPRKFSGRLPRPSWVTVGEEDRKRSEAPPKPSAGPLEPASG